MSHSTVIVRDEAMLRAIKRAEKANPRLYQRGDKNFSVPRYPLPFRVSEHIDIIFRAMDINRITYDEVKTKTGIAYNTLWAWKRAKQQPRIGQLLKVYRAVGIRMRVYIPGVDN